MSPNAKFSSFKSELWTWFISRIIPWFISKKLRKMNPKVNWTYGPEPLQFLDLCFKKKTSCEEVDFIMMKRTKKWRWTTANGGGPPCLPRGTWWRHFYLVGMLSSMFGCIGIDCVAAPISLVHSNLVTHKSMTQSLWFRMPVSSLLQCSDP